MTNLNIKEYLKQNLRFNLTKDIIGYYPTEIKLSITFYIEDEEIQEEYVYINIGDT